MTLRVRILKSLNHFDGDEDGIISLDEFIQATNGKLEGPEAEFLFLFWDSCAGKQEPRGFVEIELAVQDLLNSVPQYSTLLQGSDLADVSGQSKNNRPSQEGGIFGGGCYAAESEREILLAARNRVATPTSGPTTTAPQAQFLKPVNNASSIEGGIFGTGYPSGEPKQVKRSNRSNQSSLEGGIFGENEYIQKPPSRNGRNANASSIEGGIFG